MKVLKSLVLCSEILLKICVIYGFLDTSASLLLHNQLQHQHLARLGQLNSLNGLKNNNNNSSSNQSKGM